MRGWQPRICCFSIYVYKLKVNVNKVYIFNLAAVLTDLIRHSVLPRPFITWSICGVIPLILQPGFCSINSTANQSEISVAFKIILTGAKIL